MHLSADEKVKPLAMHSSTSNFGFSSLYDTYSNVALSFKSSIGKILLKTLSKPFVSSDELLVNLLIHCKSFFEPQ